MKTTRSAHPVHPKIGVIGVQTILAAILGLAMAFTFGCEEKSGSKAADSPKSAAEAATESKVAKGAAELAIAEEAAKAKEVATTENKIASTFTDSRDSKTYKTVKIGTQTWMAENLNYDAEGSNCYDNSESNCQKYGRLYSWHDAMEACPKGWHLPTNKEWDRLYRHADGDKGMESPYKSETAGKLLKAKSGWNDYTEYGVKYGNGTDKFGFSALPGGGYGDGYFSYAGDGGRWWSASEFNDDNAYYQGMDYSNECAYYNYDVDKYFLFSVRCVQD